MSASQHTLSVRSAQNKHRVLTVLNQQLKKLSKNRKNKEDVLASKEKHVELVEENIYRR